jgi:NAD(P)-dependent dehydrogenase (short-subunit alcohol dehydrogenase family)
MSRTTIAPFDVNGRTVFITGAARGIGAGTAERLHAKGANVALVGLEPERLEALAARLADVTDYDALERAVRATNERFGPIDVAIANAGVQFMGTLASAPIEHVERTLAVNLLGVWRTDRAVIGQIVERRGYLLNIASLAAATHGPLMGAYTASKAGVEALSDALRQETYPSGARVGCAYFGFIDTDIVRGSFAQASTKSMLERGPSRFSKPVPVARAIDAIELGVERRSARVWAPRWVGAVLTLRGVVQPLIERRVLSDPAGLTEAMRLAGPTSGAASEEDMMLGVAAKAL